MNNIRLAFNDEHITHKEKFIMICKYKKSLDKAEKTRVVLVQIFCYENGISTGNNQQMKSKISHNAHSSSFY